MKYTDNALNVLTAKTFKGIGDAWINKHLIQALPFETIVELLQKDPKCKDTVDESTFLQIKQNITDILETNLTNYCDGITAIGDENFPKYRGNVKESERPNVLFYRGDLNLLSSENKNIAVIGVLNPDKDTEIDERKIVHSLVQENAVIVSGLALGCDTIAHDQAVKSNGVTIAILPSTLNKIIPSENKELAEEIVASGGLLITEYYDQPKSAQESTSRFVKRDRLQALFSDTVLLSASYDVDSRDPTNPKIDSGSRHALAKAKEYGLQQAVIYNDKYTNNPKYDLNRAIIQDNRSAIILDPDNFIHTLDKLFHIESTPSIFQETYSEKNTDDLFSEPMTSIPTPLFHIELTDNGITIKKDKQSISLTTGSPINNGIKIILEHCLNQQYYSATIQNGMGFIKCFADKEKQQYILAIRVNEINNKKEQEDFLLFFND